MTAWKQSNIATFRLKQILFTSTLLHIRIYQVTYPIIFPFSTHFTFTREDDVIDHICHWLNVMMKPSIYFIGIDNLKLWLNHPTPTHTHTHIDESNYFTFSTLWLLFDLNWNGPGMVTTSKTMFGESILLQSNSSFLDHEICENSVSIAVSDIKFWHVCVCVCVWCSLSTEHCFGCFIWLWKSADRLSGHYRFLCCNPSIKRSPQ